MNPRYSTPKARAKHAKKVFQAEEMNRKKKMFMAARAMKAAKKAAEEAK
jgi:hypothetical protein